MVPARSERAERVVLPISVAFLCDGESATVVDTDSAPLVWGLNRILPDGTQEIVSVATDDPPSVRSVRDYWSKGRRIVPAELGKRPEPRAMKTYHLKHGDSFSRLLDLTAMCDFPVAGTYRVQIVYDNLCVADNGKGEWSGRFSGPAFELIIAK